MRNCKKVITFVMFFILVPFVLYAAVGDFLILQDIGSYKFITQSKNPLTKKIVQISGYTTRNVPGILAGADHFDLDHDDTTYKTDYESDVADLGIEVEITQHAGSDSDKWLLHELDEDFRNYFGVPGESYGPRMIDGQTILEDSVGGANWRWLSGNKIIMIQYHDSQMEKPEPLEVVSAYLAKHPSTLPAMTLAQLRSAESTSKWTKDEMDRRLWLCDKWFEQLQLLKTDQKTALQEAVKSMTVFLKFREKYYGLKSADEENLLAGYLSQNDETNIKAKLQEYKDWWSVNKTGSLIGMITSLPQRLWGQVSLFFGKIGSFFSSLLHGLLGLFG